jgi:hypothetical protein
MRRSDPPARLDVRGWLAFAWALAVLVAWSVAMVRARPAALAGLLRHVGAQVPGTAAAHADSPDACDGIAFADSSSRRKH